MGKDNTPVEIFVDVVAKTDSALLVSDGDTEAWVGFGLIHEDSTITEDSGIGESGAIIIPEWKAHGEGLI